MPGSITTLSNINPSYRIYTAEQGSNVLVDYSEYRMDLLAANANPDKTPTWDLAYTFLAEYGLSDMHPATILSWVENTLTSDESSAVKYRGNYSTHGNGGSCGEGCRKSLACQLGNGVDADVMKCNGSTHGRFDKFILELYGPWLYKYD
jgi:sphingomyelin phosphodiesterase